MLGALARRLFGSANDRFLKGFSAQVVAAPKFGTPPRVGTPSKVIVPPRVGTAPKIVTTGKKRAWR